MKRRGTLQRLRNDIVAGTTERQPIEWEEEPVLQCRFYCFAYGNPREPMITAEVVGIKRLGPGKTEFRTHRTVYVLQEGD